MNRYPVRHGIGLNIGKPKGGITYKIYEPRDIDVALAGECLRKQGLDTSHKVSMLPYGAMGNVGFETRRLYFALALGEEGIFSERPVLRGSAQEDVKEILPVTRIFSFGRCNVACPYCKRDCQFIGDDGLPIIATPVEVLDLFRLAEGAQERGETVRFSGGDPVMFPRETLAIADYMNRRHGAKVSIAHNGSGTAWVRKLALFLSSAAIDLKAVPERMGQVMGVSRELGEKIFRLSTETQKAITESGALLDVRTPVFGDTSLDDMMRLAKVITGNNPRFTFWTWRMYKPVEGCNWTVPEKERVFQMMQIVSEAFPSHWLGVRAKWERGGMVYFLGGRMVNQEETAVFSDREARGSGNLPVVA